MTKTKKRSSISRKRRRYRKSDKRVLIVTFSFLILLGLTLYGLSYIKHKVSSFPPETVTSLKLNSTIENVNELISEALFNKLDLSKKDILEEKVYSKEVANLNWNFTERTILLKKPLSKDKIIASFQEVIFRDNVEFQIVNHEDFYISEIKIFDQKTHQLKFNFRNHRLDEKKKLEGDKSVARVHVKSDKENIKIKNNEFSKNAADKPKVAIIIDDIGLDKGSVDKLIKISPKFTFAVLPNLPYSKYAAEKANNEGLDVILHLPMEPKTTSGYNGEDAGEEVLLVGQSKKEIENKLEKNLSSIPYVVGVNNHMGSKFTENNELMELVLKKIDKRGLFFVDSLTSNKSTGYKIAKKLGIRAFQRDIFLDSKFRGKDYVKKQLNSLVKKAEKRGYAVGICHPYPQTIQALTEELPKLSESVDIATISSIVD